MSGLIGDLLSNARALDVHNQAVAVSGRNLANINNPDYARQRATTEAAGPGLGLQASGLEHLRSAVLDRHITREVGGRSALEAQAEAGRWVEAALGEQIERGTDGGLLDAATAGAGSGITAAIDHLFLAFEELAANPAETASRQVLLGAAATLTERFNAIGTRLDEIGQDIGDQVGAATAGAGALLGRIAALNGQIQRAEGRSPGRAAELVDARQGAVEELASALGTEFRPASEGSPARVIARDASGAEVVLVEGARVLAIPTFDGDAVSAGDPPVALAAGGGSVGGYLDAREGVLAGLQDDLDRLAGQLVTSVNTAYDPAGTDGAFFDPGGTTATTLRLDSSVTPDSLRASSGGDGGNDIARAVAGLRHHAHDAAAGDRIDGTFVDHFIGAATAVGAAVADAAGRLEYAGVVEAALRADRDAVGGVSVDEEVTEMLRHQRAFQASARVLNIVDRMLEVVVAGLGRT